MFLTGCSFTDEYSPDVLERYSFYGWIFAPCSWESIRATDRYFSHDLDWEGIRSTDEYSPHDIERVFVRGQTLARCFERFFIHRQIFAPCVWEGSRWLPMYSFPYVRRILSARMLAYQSKKRVGGGKSSFPELELTSINSESHPGPDWYINVELIMSYEWQQTSSIASLVKSVNRDCASRFKPQADSPWSRCGFGRILRTRCR